jgi:hypothetical protein
MGVHHIQFQLQVSGIRRDGIEKDDFASLPSYAKYTP